MRVIIVVALALLMSMPLATAAYYGWGGVQRIDNTYGKYGYAPYTTHPRYSQWENRPEGYLQYTYDGPSAYPRTAQYCDQVSFLGHYTRWSGDTGFNYYSAYTAQRRITPRARTLPHCQARYPLNPNRLMLP